MNTTLYHGPIAGTPFAKPDFTTLTVGDIVTVTPEPSNQYDPNAHVVTKGSMKLGYVPKTQTYRYRTAPYGETRIVKLDPTNKWNEITIETLSA